MIDDDDDYSDDADGDCDDNDCEIIIVWIVYDDFMNRYRIASIDLWL